jgi:carotenoid cleavage dioxygenase-like enzyme
VHDFALSPRCAAFYLAPYLLDVAALLEQGSTVLDSLSWRPELGTRLRVVARDDGRTIVDLPLGERYCLHHVNAFEDGDRLVLDLLELEEPVYRDYQGLPELFVGVAPTHPVRLSVDLTAGRLLSRREIPLRWAADFPTHHPALRGRRCRSSFMLAIAATGQTGRKFFDRLVGLDWEELAVAQTYAARPGCYLGGDPVVAPTPEGDFVLCQEHDPVAGRSSLLLFAATELARGPIAAVPLAGALPPGFHAGWTAD